jgi:hypothetical protein
VSAHQEDVDAFIDAIYAGVPTRTALGTRISRYWFYRELERDPVLAERYARARAFSMDAIADAAMEIADDPEIDANQKRIMVDARKWFLSKLAPKKYGDKLELGSDPDKPLLTKIVREIVRTPNPDG